MSSNLGIIISREIRERVVKKSFILTTLLTPLFMVLMMVAPALIMELSTPSEKNMAVIDNSGLIFPELVKESESLEYLKLSNVSLPLGSVLESDDYDAILWVNGDVVENPQDVVLYQRDAGSMLVEGTISNIINTTVENQRLRSYNIENLGDILDEVKVDSILKVIRIDEDGNGESVSSSASFFLGLAKSFILYMFLLMYCQIDMTSIIEEKNNIVLERVVS